MLEVDRKRIANARAIRFVFNFFVFERFKLKHFASFFCSFKFKEIEMIVLPKQNTNDVRHLLVSTRTVFNVKTASNFGIYRLKQKKCVKWEKNVLKSERKCWRKLSKFSPPSFYFYQLNVFILISFSTFSISPRTLRLTLTISCLDGLHFMHRELVSSVVWMRLKNNPFKYQRKNGSLNTQEWNGANVKSTIDEV